MIQFCKSQVGHWHWAIRKRYPLDATIWRSSSADFGGWTISNMNLKLPGSSVVVHIHTTVGKCRFWRFGTSPSNIRWSLYSEWVDVWFGHLPTPNRTHPSVAWIPHFHPSGAVKKFAPAAMLSERWAVWCRHPARVGKCSCPETTSLEVFWDVQMFQE